MLYNDTVRKGLIQAMKFWKDLTTGAVIKAPTAPTGKWWREATEREYNARKAYVAHLMGNLEKAVAYKARLLKA